MKRPLTFKEQQKLFTEMSLLHLTQIEIAKRNNLKTTTTINRFCRGEYNITPKIIEQFKNCNIDIVNDILDNG